MIYEFPNEEEPIRQGDIFFPIPNMAMDLDQILIMEDQDTKLSKWEELTDLPQQAALTIDKSWAIVASQDCDTVRAPTITFFVITPLFKLRNPEEFKSKTPKTWMEWITKKSTEDGKWFYLPPDSKLGFEERMMVVFQNIIQIPREGLEKRKNLRKGRLNKEADEHFRESIAQFFRRYPYNEWYPLNKEEFEAYDKDKEGGISSYPWQR